MQSELSQSRSASIPSASILPREFSLAKSFSLFGMRLSAASASPSKPIKQSGHNDIPTVVVVQSEANQPIQQGAVDECILRVKEKQLPVFRISSTLASCLAQPERGISLANAFRV